MGGSDDESLENQSVFRKGKSCQDQIFSLNEIIEKCLDQKLTCLINFIDFEGLLNAKAVFDSVTDLPFGKSYASMVSCWRLSL